jgi:transcriptional regulator with XRE-family HTH domain
VEGTSLLSRIADAVGEALVERDLSLRELSQLSGVSRATCTKLAKGGRVRPDLAVKIATAVAVVDLYSTPPTIAPVPETPCFDDGVDVVLREELALRVAS